MTEKELIGKIKEFKSVKPDKDWADLLLSNILTKSSVVIASEAKQSNNKPKISLASFSFIFKYQKAIAPALFAVLFVSTFAFAQNSLPGNPLYPIKTLAQEAKIYFASKENKPVVYFTITQERFNDLSKISAQKGDGGKEERVSSLAKNLEKEIKSIPQEIKKIENRQSVLNVSKKIQAKGRDLKESVAKSALPDLEKENLVKTMEEADKEVLALIMETIEQINLCPSSLSLQMENIEKHFSNINNLSGLNPDEILKIQPLLIEARNQLKVGNCLEALTKIESVNKLLQIHSLDLTPTPNEP